MGLSGEWGKEWGSGGGGEGVGYEEGGEGGVGFKGNWGEGGARIMRNGEGSCLRE